jgi:hypothetical protein
MDVRPGKTVNLSVTERDVWLIRAALHEYLASFSHTERPLVDEIKSVLERLPIAGDPRDPVNQVFPEGGRLTL